MNKMLLLVLSLISLSCQKKSKIHLIKPQKTKGLITESIFPFSNYTTIKSFIFNKPDPKRVNKKWRTELDSLKKIDFFEEYFQNDEDTLNLRKHNNRVFELESLIKVQSDDKSIITEGGILHKAEIVKILNNKEKKTLLKIMTQNPKNKKSIPISTCAIYRDAFIFYNNDKIVGWINICFQCKKIEFGAPNYKKKYFFQENEWKDIRAFLMTLGHDVDYHLKEQIIYY